MLHAVVKMRYFLLLLCIAHTEQVVLRGEFSENTMMILSNLCEGYVEILHNGRWGFVGDKYWSRETEKVVCRTTQCGDPEDGATEDVFMPSDSLVWLNEVQCTGNETNLLDCKWPGWNISKYRKMTVKKIKCSNRIRISLDGFTCAGAVQYSTDRKKPSAYFCSDNWGENEANQLCEKLKCGKSKEIPQIPWMVFKGFQKSKKMTIMCSGTKHEKNLWQCANRESECNTPASVICEGYERLQLRGNASNACSGQLEREEDGVWKPVTRSRIGPDEWCRQMYCGTNVSQSQDGSGTNLTCSEKVEVVLMDKGKPSSCYGAVHVLVNGKSQPVCASIWNEQSAAVVCRELNCGRVIAAKTLTEVKVTGKLDNVTCSGNESSLWHCRAQHAEAQNYFQCTTNAYVICANSISVRVKDGQNKCAGRVEIRYDGQWKRIASHLWSSSNSDAVCKFLGCGNTTQPAELEKYSQGSGQFLMRNVSCSQDVTNISECIGNDLTQSELQRQGELLETVGVTCQENQVISLEGSSCSGNVWIKLGSEKYWLSGSEKTWNKDVAKILCQEINCGEVKNNSFSLRADDSPVIQMSCSTNSTSLFECENETLPSNRNATIASVMCSGELTLNLTNGCWGNVMACVEGKCGGVCADTWTDSKSLALCEKLGCGTRALRPNNPPKPGKVMIKSVHSRKQTDDLLKYQFVRYDDTDNSCFQKPAYVVCSGSIKPKLESRDKCSGNVRIYYEDQWLPVCEEALQNDKTKSIICKELGCNQPKTIIDYFGPKTQSHVISQIQCLPNDKSISSCNITSERSSCTLAGLRCSKWAQIALHKGDNDVCSGDVFAHLPDNTIVAVPDDGWTSTEGEMLCKDLKCNTLDSLSGITAVDSLWNRSFSCKNVTNPESIWDCEKKIQSKKQKQLHIKCHGEPMVTLSKKCYGEVKIDGTAVCGTDWKYSDLVCQEMSCSNAINNSIAFLKEIKPRKDEEYYHVVCEPYHYKLSQCKRFKGKCDKGLVSVSCVGNIKFRSSRISGGQIEVNYRDKWEKVYTNKRSISTERKLCDEVRDQVHNETKTTATLANLDTVLECSEDQQDIRHCIRYEPQRKVKPAVITCNDLTDGKTDNKGTVMKVVLGVGLLLLIILVIVLVRICIVKRGRWPKNLPLTTISRKGEEFESGEYEDVNSKGNERMDYRLRSESEVMMENDRLSIPSLSYDDVEEAQPLTSKADSAFGDNSHHDNVLDKTDGTSYKDYDDVEACPEVTQTHAEVHGSPKSTAEHDTVAPPELVEGDDDYLKPGQDG